MIDICAAAVLTPSTDADALLSLFSSTWRTSSGVISAIFSCFKNEVDEVEREEEEEEEEEDEEEAQGIERPKEPKRLSPNDQTLPISSIITV